MNVRLHQARRWALIAGIPAIILGVLVYAYVGRQPRTYAATATLYVEQASNTGSYIPGLASPYESQLLVPTYSQMIMDPVLAPTVDRMMARRYPGYRLEAHSVSSTHGTTTDTQLVSVTVTDAVPSRAADAANAVASAFINRVTAMESARFQRDEKTLQDQINTAQANILTTTRQINNYVGGAAGLSSLKTTLSAYQSTYQALVSSSQQFKATRDSMRNSVSIYSPAGVPAAPTGPHPFRTALLAALALFFLFGGGLYVYDYFDDSPRSLEEIEELAGAPILGTVHRFSTQRVGSALITLKQPRSPISEAYRLVRTNIQFTNVDAPPRTIVVTSPRPSEGKSTTVANLAEVFAQGGDRVQLVDGDLRRPSLHRVFATDRRDGLSTMLATDHLNGHGQYQSEQPNLRIIPSGPLPPNPADLVGSDRMSRILAHLRSESDMLFIDSPPVLAVADAAILSTMADGVILVVDPAQTKRRDVRRAREAIEAVGGKILGLVINRISPRGSLHYYYYPNYGSYRYDEETTNDGSTSKGWLLRRRSKQPTA